MEEVYKKLFESKDYNIHPDTELRYQLSLKEIEENSYSSYLDISSGRGILIDLVHKFNPNIDISYTDIEDYAKKPFKFIKLNLNDDSYQINKKFDFLTCLDVLEHLEKDKIENILYNISKLSKEFLFTIANHSDIHNGIELHTIQENEFFWGNLLEKFYNIIKFDKKLFGKNELYIYKLKNGK